MVIKKLVFIFCMLFILSFVGGVFALGGIRVPVDLDQEKPVLVAFDYSIKHKKVTFNFEIEEDNLRQVYYRDVAKCSRTFVKYDTLCKRISKDGKCFAVRDLCVGEHSMQITIVDKAKNEIKTEVFDFEIV